MPSINIYYACLGVCLYPVNVKTAEPIGPEFFVGLHIFPRKVYEKSKFQKLASSKIKFSLNFHKIFKIREHYFCFTTQHKENMYKNEIEDGRKAP